MNFVSKMFPIIHVIGIVCLIQFSSGYQVGPPIATCLTLFPKHDNLEAQMTEPPFIVSLREGSYSPGQEIHIIFWCPVFIGGRSRSTWRNPVTVKGKNGKQFMAMQIAAHRTKGDTEEFIGEFTQFPTNKLKTLNCIDGQRNMVAHKNKDLVSEVNITWRAPSVNEGNLTFSTTIVEHYRSFWINILNSLPSRTNVPVVPVYEVTKGREIKIDFDKCGKSLGCILYPNYCSGENCDAGATFQDEGNRTRFQLFAKNPEGYVSIGLSDDRLMGGDHTISCTVQGDQYTVQHGYNPAFFNYRQYKKNELQDMTVALKDDKLYCEFTRPKLMSVVNMFNPSERLEFDINNDYYVMIAWGFSHYGSPAITHHIELPFTTQSKVDFRSTKIYRGSALPYLTQVHALLMIIAWILFTGIATIIARYFKSSFGEKMVLGVKVWFQAHRATAVVAAIVTAVSFIIIFVKVDGLTKVAETHAYVGIALMAVTTLQVIAGLLRPDPKSGLRPIFNWGHWFMGKASHILAAASVFLAYNIELIPKTQSLFGIVISIIWVVCQVLWELFYEIRHRRRETSENKGKVTVKKADMVLLFIYITNMCCVLAVSIMAIYFF